MKISPLFFLFAFTIFPTGWVGSEEFPETFQFNRLQIAKNPQKIPFSIPSYLVPQGSKLLFSADLKSAYYNSLESFLVFVVDSHKEALDSYYISSMQNREWKLLQTDKKPNQSTFLSEGFSRKVLSVYLVKLDENQTKVSIVYKRNSSY